MIAPETMSERGTIYQADCLEVLSRMRDESVDLIYIDPPFGTQTVRRLRTQKKGVITGTVQYRDQLDPLIYLEELRLRLWQMRRVLRPTGSIYVHMDYHHVHDVRYMMDEMFGISHFLNEIIWSYDFGGRAKNKWPRKHDNILWYSKGKKWTFNPDAIERLPYMAPGLAGPEKAARGKLPTDSWFMTIVPTQGRERTGYPTQKPMKLLERIITSSSNPGDLVADFYCGSGTTGDAAQKHGRRYLLVDDNPEAIAITRRRLNIDEIQEEPEA